MDFDQFTNNLNFKKLIFIIIIAFIGLEIMREIIFWGFVHTFKSAYSTFVTQFDKDQQSIHNVIENAFKEQEKWAKDFDKYSEEFHKEVEEGFRKHAEFMNKPGRPFVVTPWTQKQPTPTNSKSGAPDAN
jgi:hypothetical protein